MMIVIMCDLLHIRLQLSREKTPKILLLDAAEAEN